jgi:glutathione S-transferase
MKLYFHPASTTSRPVMLFASEARIPLDMQVVDLFTGEHHQPPFDAVNPNHLVPVLDDGGFRLTESSAILKYLADKADSPMYPKDLQQRARINERMDWVNTQLCRDFAYGFIYPQIFPAHKRPNADVQQATLQWGQERAKGWMKVLNDSILGEANAYVCGDKITIADCYAASFVALGEITGSNYAAYPKVQAWLGRMKALPSWKEVNAAIDGYAASLKGSPMLAV